MPMQIALDAMGGDAAPTEIVAGAILAVQNRPDHIPEFSLQLAGDEAAIEPLISENLNGRNGASADLRSRLHIKHATQVVGMSESPVEGLKRSPDSSIAHSVRLVASGECQGLVTAGNTGAAVAATHQALGRIKGIRRPGIAVLLPTDRETPVLVVDVGATVTCKPIILQHFGIMGNIFARSVMKIDRPKVGLLNIGEEEGKGNDLVRETRELLSSSDLHFIGNVEGQDICRGKCDVVVCEGFVGNVVLKVTEGMAEFMTDFVRGVAGEHQTAECDDIVNRLHQKTHFSSYGGAILLGINGICIICHGRSDRHAIANAIYQAVVHAEAGVTQRIIEGLPRAEELG